MGQIADDIRIGFQCSNCGVCFEKEHDYPVLCEDCYADELKETGRTPDVPKATNPEL